MSQVHCIVLTLASLLFSLTANAASREVGQELMIGIMTNDVELIDAALKKGANINETPALRQWAVEYFKSIDKQRGFTPLIWALELSDQKTIDALITRGAKPDPDSLEAKSLQTLLELNLLQSACNMVGIWGDYARKPLDKKVLQGPFSVTCATWTGPILGNWQVRSKLLENDFKDPFGNRLDVPKIGGPFRPSVETLEETAPFTKNIPKFWGEFNEE